MRRRQNSERNDKVETSPSSEDRKDDTNEIIPNVRVKNNNFDVKKKRIKTKFEGSGIKTFLKKTGRSDIKETLKRPLTGLFRKTPKDVDVKNEEVTQSNSSSSIKDSVVPFNKESFSTDVIEIHGTGMDDSDDLKHDTPPHDRSQSLLSLTVIEPPKLTMSEMNAIYPLEILNNNAYNQYKVDEIDLNYITRFMWLEDECNDESIQWTWDYLFANVSYEMREETIDDEDEVEDMYKNSTFMA